MFSQSLIVTAIGISGVFIFLIFLVFLMQFTCKVLKFIGKYYPEKEDITAALPVSAVDEKIIAAITAAKLFMMKQKGE